MAFKDFASVQYIKSIDTSEEPQMGGFAPPKDTEIAHIRVMLYIEDVTSLGGTEQIRCKFYSEATSVALQYTSDWSSISDITNLGTANWIGWIRMDFNRENLNKNTTYYPRIELRNYTRSGDAFWIGVSRDFPFPVYDNSQNFFYDHPLAMQWFWYVDKADQ